jgi:outer membrane protein assembly factor BamD
MFDRGAAAARTERFDVARLALQTLLNTYPDSSYASKAKELLHDSRIADCGESWATSSGSSGYLDEPEWQD